MRKGHFAIFFVIIACYFFMEIFVEQIQYRQVKKEKEKIEDCLLYAVDTAAWKLTEIMEESNEIKLYTLQESFFEALYIRLGISGDGEKREKMKLFVPLIAWLDEEGGYFFYTEEKVDGEKAILEQKWSDCIPYQLSESEEENKRILVNYLEENVSDIITDHNFIAGQYGIGYEFFVPYFLTEEAKEVSLPMIIVVFQGWPLKGSGNYYYENCIDVNAYIKKTSGQENSNSSF